MLSEEEIGVRKKGLNFCPNQTLDKFEIYKDLHLFIRKLILRKLFQKQGIPPDCTLQESRALDNLVSLLQESDPTDLIDRVDLQQILDLVEKQGETITSTLKKTITKLLRQH